LTYKPVWCASYCCQFSQTNVKKKDRRCPSSFSTGVIGVVGGDNAVSPRNPLHRHVRVVQSIIRQGQYPHIAVLLVRGRHEYAKLILQDRGPFAQTNSHKEKFGEKYEIRLQQHVLAYGRRDG